MFKYSYGVPDKFVIRMIKERARQEGAAIKNLKVTFQSIRIQKIMKLYKISAIIYEL